MDAIAGIQPLIAEGKKVAVETFDKFNAASSKLRSICGELGISEF